MTDFALYHTADWRDGQMPKPEGATVVVYQDTRHRAYNVPTDEIEAFKDWVALTYARDNDPDIEDYEEGQQTTDAYLEDIGVTISEVPQDAPIEDRGETIILAQMICDLTEAQLQPCEFKRVQEGENPHDLFDANSVLYGAWCAMFFEEPVLTNETTIELLNAATAICQAQKYDRKAIRSLLYGDEDE